MITPLEGQKYKHRQIKDVIYEIVAVDSQKGKVILQDNVHGAVISVSFAQLQVNYKKV